MSRFCEVFSPGRVFLELDLCTIRVICVPALVPAVPEVTSMSSVSMFFQNSTPVEFNYIEFNNIEANYIGNCELSQGLNLGIRS